MEDVNEMSTSEREAMFDSMIDGTYTEEVEEIEEDVEEVVEDAEEEVVEEEESEEVDNDADDNDEEESVDEGTEEEEEDEAEESEEVEEEELPEITEAEKRIAELEEEDKAKQAEKETFDERVANYVDFNDIAKEDGLLDLDDLPDIPVGTGEKATTLKAFASDYPEMMEVFNMLLGSTVKKQTAKDTQATNEEVDRLRFKSNLNDTIEGGYATIQTKAFSDWLGEQSKGIQRLASSNDLNDSKLVIESFRATKEEKAKPVKKAKKKIKSTKKKDKMKAVLGDNIKSKAEKPSKVDHSNGDFDPSTFDREAEWEAMMKKKEGKK